MSECDNDTPVYGTERMSQKSFVSRSGSYGELGGSAVLRLLCQLRVGFSARKSCFNKQLRMRDFYWACLQFRTLRYVVLRQVPRAFSLT